MNAEYYIRFFFFEKRKKNDQTEYKWKPDWVFVQRMTKISFSTSLVNKSFGGSHVGTLQSHVCVRIIGVRARTHTHTHKHAVGAFVKQQPATTSERHKKRHTELIDIVHLYIWCCRWCVTHPCSSPTKMRIYSYTC